MLDTASYSVCRANDKIIEHHSVQNLPGGGGLSLSLRSSSLSRDCSKSARAAVVYLLFTLAAAATPELSRNARSS